MALDSDGRVVRDSGVIDGLDPGGGIFGPDGRYNVGLRSARTIMEFSSQLSTAGKHILPPGIVPFPRGFAFGHDRRPFLSSGIGPNGLVPFRKPRGLHFAPDGNLHCVAQDEVVVFDFASGEFRGTVVRFP